MVVLTGLKVQKPFFTLPHGDYYVLTHRLACCNARTLSGPRKIIAWMVEIKCKLHTQTDGNRVDVNDMTVKCVLKCRLANTN